MGTSPADPGAALGQGRVLIMDDNEDVRNLIAEILRQLGYLPGQASDGDMAVTMYREAMEEGHPFKLVLMDLTIPGKMGGREAIVELKALDPKVKAVICSGYPDDPVMINYREYGFRGVIGKPYRLADLRRLLQQLMAED